MDELIPVDKEKERREELRRIEELSDIRKVLSFAEGRRLYWRYMSRARAFVAPYTGEVNSTMHNCGEQTIGFFMLNELLDASPSSFTQMQREAKSKAKRQEEEDNKK